jgi:hypothetical protein
MRCPGDPYLSRQISADRRHRAPTPWPSRWAGRRPAELPCGICGRPTDGDGHRQQVLGAWSYFCDDCSPQAQKEWDLAELRRKTHDGPRTLTPEEYVERLDRRRFSLCRLQLGLVSGDSQVVAWCRRALELTTDIWAAPGPVRRGSSRETRPARPRRHEGAGTFVEAEQSLPVPPRDNRGPQWALNNPEHRAC